LDRHHRGRHLIHYLQAANLLRAVATGSCSSWWHAAGVAVGAAVVVAVAEAVGVADAVVVVAVAAVVAATFDCVGTDAAAGGSSWQKPGRCR